LDIRLQTASLLRKNFILMKRSARTTLLQIVVPFIFVAVVFLLQLSTQSNDQKNEVRAAINSSTIEEIQPLARCMPYLPGATTCVTFAYTSTKDPNVVTVMDSIRDSYGIPDSEVMGFATTDDSNLYLFENPNSTQGVYHLQFDYGCSPVDEYCLANTNRSLADVVGVSFVLQYNQTTVYLKGQQEDLIRIRVSRVVCVCSSGANRSWCACVQALPYQKALDEALLRLVPGAAYHNLSLHYAMRRSPQPLLAPSDLIGTTGSVFFFAALMFNFVVQVGAIVREKEDHLREQMTIMGLMDSVRGAPCERAWWCSRTRCGRCFGSPGSPPTCSSTLSPVRGHCCDDAKHDAACMSSGHVDYQWTHFSI
jgi:hypothetical protein